LHGPQLEAQNSNRTILPLKSESFFLSPLVSSISKSTYLSPTIGLLFSSRYFEILFPYSDSLFSVESSSKSSLIFSFPQLLVYTDRVAALAILLGLLFINSISFFFLSSIDKPSSLLRRDCFNVSVSEPVIFACFKSV